MRPSRLDVFSRLTPPKPLSPPPDDAHARAVASASFILAMGRKRRNEAEYKDGEPNDQKRGDEDGDQEEKKPGQLVLDAIRRQREQSK